MTRAAGRPTSGARTSAWMCAALVASLAGCLSFHAGPLPGAPPQATYATIEGVHLRYSDTGSGPAIVLVHGFASALDSWKGVAKSLGQNHRVLSLDLKGFGWSARPEGDYSPQAEAKLVLGLMRARGIERAAVVGHSWGSSVVLAMALEAPERVSRIALYDAWVYEDQLPTFFLWSRASGLGEALFGLWYSERAGERIGYAFYDKKRFVTEAFVEEVDHALERPGTTAAALAAVRGQRFSELEARYASVKQPALLLWGREDEVTLLSFGERLARDLPHARLVVYPKCGHFPMIEAAGPSTADLTAFLDEEDSQNKKPEKAPKTEGQP
jgi:pimeloyl-ACP methyl ester carboxylesterase